MEELLRKIDRWVEAHREEMKADIAALVAIPSQQGEAAEGAPFGAEPARALAAALALCERYGFATRDYDHCVGAADLGSDPPRLDILAHLDVVAAGSGWDSDPFTLTERDGRIFGRGVADDKGPAVAALYAMRAVKELGIPVSRNVRLILGTDEECGSSDIEHYYAVEKEAPMTFSPDANFPVINTEKGMFRGHFTAEWGKSTALPRLCALHAGIKVNVLPGKAEAVLQGVTAEDLEAGMKETEKAIGVRFEVEYSDYTPEKGDQMARVTAVGEGAHAAYPDDGNNALTGLIRLINCLPLVACPQIEFLKKLESCFPHGDVRGEALGIAMEDEISGPLTLVFSMLEVTESGLEGWFDSRCPVCADEENVLKPVKAQMEKLGFAFLTDRMTPPHHVPGDSGFVQTLLRVYEEYTGRKGACESTGGGTYVHDLKNGVAFGAAMPETDNRMHGADEFAVIDELLTSAKIFAQAIAELCR